MIYYLLLLLLPVVQCCQSAAQKQYNLKYEAPNVILFSAITSVMALAFVVITSGFKLSFNIALVPYALGFAVAYASAWVGTVLAVRYGLMAISSLIISCSLIFPTALGIMLGEEVTAKTIVGMVLILAAIVLVNLRFSDRGKFSVKWLLCTLVAFLGNGVCAIMQNLQKRDLGDSYSHEFMIIALAAASVLLLAYGIFTSKSLKADLVACIPYSAANGIANAVNNLLTLVIIGNIPNTVFYPTNAALGMVFTFIMAFVLYRERFTLPQYIGYALGLTSIVMLNI